MNYYVSLEQMNKFHSLMREEADKLPPRPQGSKYTNLAYVDSNLILEFRDGKPYQVKYLEHNLGLFHDFILRSDDHPIPIKEKGTWLKTLEDHPNAKLSFNQGSDGAVMWTQTKAIYTKTIMLTDECE